MTIELLDKYLKFEPEQTLNYQKISNLLGINFSLAFKEIGKKARFDYLSNIDFFSVDQEEDYSIIGETLRLRKDANLPMDTLVLSEDDASILLMKCLGDHEEIYWIAIEDYYNYCEGKKLEYDPTIFPTFTDFFVYLLDEEEKHRAETQPK